MNNIAREPGAVDGVVALPPQIIFLNRYFYPDHSATSQMLSGVAFGLAQRGERVAIITSGQRYDDPKATLPARESVRGVEIHRVRTTRFGRFALAGRMIDYATFYISAAYALWRIARAGDVIVAKTDPPMLSLLAAPIARLRGASLVNWLQDIFPEVAVAIGVGRGRLAGACYCVLAALRTRSLKRASGNVVLGERMAAKLQEFGIEAQQIRIIPNWADGASVRPVDHADNRLRKDWRLADKFVVGYSGNLGRAHDYKTFLEAIRLIETNGLSESRIRPATAGGIVWLFIGGGAQFAAFQDDARRLGLRSIAFREYQPQENLGESLSAADVHLVTLNPNLEGLIVPSKYYGIAAAGRAAIFVGDADGEIARILAKCKSGRTIAMGDAAGLADLVMGFAREPERINLMGRNARAAFDASFDLSRAVESWAQLLDEVRGHGRSALKVQ